MDTSNKLRLKEDHLSSVTATTPNLDQNWRKCYQRRPYHFRTACFSMSENIFLATSENLSTEIFFKYNTCLRWPLYKGPQGDSLRQVWLYIIYIITSWLSQNIQWIVLILKSIDINLCADIRSYLQSNSGHIAPGLEELCATTPGGRHFVREAIRRRM